MTEVHPPPLSGWRAGTAEGAAGVKDNTRFCVISHRNRGPILRVPGVVAGIDNEKSEQKKGQTCVEGVAMM